MKQQPMECHIFLVSLWFLVISLFKMAPQCCAEVFSRDLACQKTEMYLSENIHVLDKLHLGMRSSAVSVNSMLLNH